MPAGHDPGPSDGSSTALFEVPGLSLAIPGAWAVPDSCTWNGDLDVGGACSGHNPALGSYYVRRKLTKLLL
jgi:hypothetical protein